jgi:hypothetical protein
MLRTYKVYDKGELLFVINSDSDFIEHPFSNERMFYDGKKLIAVVPTGYIILVEYL